MPIVQTVAVTSHRVPNCGVRISRERASSYSEINVILARVDASFIWVIPLKDLGGLLWPVVINTWQTYKHVV